MATTSDDASLAPAGGYPQPFIRLATPQDIQAIEELDRLSTSPTRAIHRDMEKYFGSVDPTTHERNFVFLAEVGEQVAGKAELMTPPLLTADELAYQDGSAYARVGYVRRVIVDPGFRKLGLARALMLHVIAYARSELQLTTIDLHVWEGNLPAIRLYESLGFQLQHRELYFRLGL